LHRCWGGGQKILTIREYRLVGLTEIEKKKERGGISRYSKVPSSNKKRKVKGKKRRDELVLTK